VDPVRIARRSELLDGDVRAGDDSILPPTAHLPAITPTGPRENNRGSYSSCSSSRWCGGGGDGLPLVDVPE